MTDIPVTGPSSVTSKGNVAQFKPRPKTPKPVEPAERLLFVCGECQCRTFNLMSDGSIECSYCDEPLRPGEGEESQWRKCMPSHPEDTSKIKEDTGFSEHQLPDASMARRRTLKRVTEWEGAGTAAILGGVNKDAEGSWWVDFDTEEQRQWVLRRISEIREFVTEYELGTPAVAHRDPIPDPRSDG
jgi:hypothetical protein